MSTRKRGSITTIEKTLVSHNDFTQLKKVFREKFDTYRKELWRVIKLNFHFFSTVKLKSFSVLLQFLPI
jgi:hypothetical protein